MSNVIEFSNKKIENTKVSTKERIPRKYPIRTEILSDMMTDRARKIGAIEQDQSFVVESTNGDEVVTEMKGYVE
jgi:hypothetical protein